MSGFCGECGFALDKDYKFCPNCGSKLESVQSSYSKVENTSVANREVIICTNCGEENSIDTNACESCGATLSSGILKKFDKPPVVEPNASHKEGRNQKSVKKVSTKQTKQNQGNENQAQNHKELNSKVIIGIVGGIIAVVIFVLFISGVFNGTTTNEIKTQNQQTNSGVNLNNLEAISNLEKSIAANPDDMTLILQLANLQNDSGLHDKAIQSYEKYLDKNPSDADARIDLGVCYYNKSNFSKAISEMEEALKYAPNHQIAHLNLGIVNLSAGNLQTAKEWFQKTVDIDPNSDAGKRAQELLKSH
jgi:tetratricopeptide (TPR) repeat protein/RNA polymerase subunit RPABC4/transcription elongation factor Spt4